VDQAGDHTRDCRPGQNNCIPGAYARDDQSRAEDSLRRLMQEISRDPTPEELGSVVGALPDKIREI